MSRRPVIVCVAGGFDPLHIGHIKHLKKAKEFGDFLIVLVSNDDDMSRKKGYCFMPIKERIAIVKSIRYVDKVIETMDSDGTQAKTIRFLRPDIYAKGGDRTPDNMPENEVQACYEVGCTFKYGIGKIENSSSRLVKDAGFSPSSDS